MIDKCNKPQAKVVYWDIKHKWNFDFSSVEITFGFKLLFCFI
jgi:hypothetical protein